MTLTSRNSLIIVAMLVANTYVYIAFITLEACS